MNAILEFLRSIGDVVNALFTFVANTILSLFNLISRIPTVITFLTSSIAMLPTVIMPFMVASISIYVIYLILGRN